MVDRRIHPSCPWRTLQRCTWFLPSGSTATAVKPASSPPDDKTVLRKTFSTACDMLQDWLWKTPLCDLGWRIAYLLYLESAYINYTQWWVLSWHLHACTWSYSPLPPILSSCLSSSPSSQLVTLLLPSLLLWPCDFHEGCLQECVTLSLATPLNLLYQPFAPYKSLGKGPMSSSPLVTGYW